MQSRERQKKRCVGVGRCNRQGRSSYGKTSQGELRQMGSLKREMFLGLRDWW
jgi:hypothetical protein